MRYSADTIHKVEMKTNFISIDLEQYHRSAAAIFPNSTVFLVPEPGENAIIVTTINPDSWGDLWRLEIELRDEPGAFE